MNTTKVENLSVIIITFNEAHDLRACLESATSLAGEIIVVDSGSTDETVSIAKEYTPHVFYQEWAGYSAQKQVALNKTSKEWVINIDADERITSSLAKEIHSVLKTTRQQYSGYSIPFDHYFLGKKLCFGRWSKERHIRLFRRNSAQYGQQKIHEGIELDGPVGTLGEPISHHSYQSIKEYMDKCNAYTTAIAEKKYARGERLRFFHHWRLPYEFVVRYFFKFGFLDGMPGFVYAVLSSYYVWLKYVKLIDVEQGRH